MLKTRKIKKLLFNLILLLISLLVFFILFEILLRIFYPQNLNYAEFDTTLGVGYTLRKDFHGIYNSKEYTFEVKTNSKGLREEIEHPYSKPDNIKRILFLGDSFTFGESVNIKDTYPQQLLQKLRSNGFNNIEAINTGVPSYSTYIESMYLKNEGYKYNPDIVVLGFFIGNDFGGDLFAKENVEEITNVLITKKPFKKYLSLKLRRFGSSHSHTYIFIRDKLRSNQLIKDVLSKVGILGKKSEFSIFDIENYNIFEDKNTTEDLEKTKEIIMDMNKFTSNNNIILILLIIPQKEQVNPNYFKEYWDLYPNKINIQRPQNYLINFTKESNLIYVDPLPSLRKYDRNNTFYWNIDGHIKPNGHKLIADLIYESLINNKLIY